MANPTVTISGCHSGPNPSPGLGLARSLREAYPEARLIAKDHAAQCSGLHDPIFDDVWLCRPWNELDLDLHREQIHDRLGDGCLYLPGLDLEARWLASPPHPRILTPPAPAIRSMAKPEFPGAAGLPLRLPAWISHAAPPREIHAFCRAHDWKVWVKGAAYEAKRARTWPEVERAVDDLRDTWGESEIHLQQGIPGHEVSIVFVAWRGRLLDALFMEKRQLTEAGKTWSGVLSQLDAQWEEALGALVAEANWSGGSELEFIRDAAGRLWLMDWNPRFPAWIHATTLAGRNFPALLVEAASGVEIARRSPRRSMAFTRVVTEIPVCTDIPIHPLPHPAFERQTGSKHPSGMPLMMRRLRSTEGAREITSRIPVTPRRVAPAPSDAPPGLFATEEAHDIREAASTPGPTPVRVLLPRVAARRFERLARLRDLSTAPGLAIRPAYSCKTNPAPEFLALARENAMLAEVIAPEELEWCVENGFSPEAIVYNGPVRLTEDALAPGRRLHALFADSVEALERYVARRDRAQCLGARLRPPFLDSRFGIDIEEYEEFAALTELIRAFPPEQPLGLSFHIQSSRVGVRHWQALLPGVLEHARALEELTDRRVEVLDLGGGHAPEDIDALLDGAFADLVAEARRRLPALREILLEPGKALVEPCAALTTTVLERRRRGGGRSEIVVDASIAELPLAALFPHRVVACAGERIEELGRGQDRVLGRLCMEDDVLLSDATLPAWLGEGDRLVILDCGAYDASMAYSFGKGYLHESATPILPS